VSRWLISVCGQCRQPTWLRVFCWSLVRRAEFNLLTMRELKPAFKHWHIWSCNLCKLELWKLRNSDFSGNRLVLMVDPRGRTVWGVGLRPLACWNCGFESRRGYGCLSLISVVYCHVELSASGWSLVQRSPTEYSVSNWVWSWILDNEEVVTHGSCCTMVKKKC
jgi:hypothetical protein